MSYCTKDEVNSLFGDISDDVSDSLFATVIDNSTAWIDSNLIKNNVPIPDVTFEEVEDTTEDEVEVDEVDDTTGDEVEENDEVEETETENETTSSVTQSTTTVIYNLTNIPNGLRTAAIYYAASDILLTLYHGEELPVQYDVWFNKAQQLLDDYIEAYLNENADSGDAVAHQMVKHSHGLTYNQKQRRFY